MKSHPLSIPGIACAFILLLFAGCDTDPYSWKYEQIGDLIIAHFGIYEDYVDSVEKTVLSLAYREDLQKKYAIYISDDMLDRFKAIYSEKYGILSRLARMGSVYSSSLLNEELYFLTNSKITGKVKVANKDKRVVCSVPVSTAHPFYLFPENPDDEEAVGAFIFRNKEYKLTEKELVSAIGNVNFYNSLPNQGKGAYLVCYTNEVHHFTLAQKGNKYKIDSMEREILESELR